MPLAFNLFVFLEAFPFLLFLAYKLHELSDILHWIEVNIIEVFATWTIHKFMFLARKIINNPSQKRWDITFANLVQLEVIDLSGELLEVSL